MRHGVRLIAAHVLGSETYHASNTVREKSSLLIRTFTDLWETEKFLDVLAGASDAQSAWDGTEPAPLG